MAHLVAEEIGFGQEWNSPSHTVTNHMILLLVRAVNVMQDFMW